MNTSIISNNSTAPSIYAISVTVLNAQLVSNICWIVASTLGMITGLLQITTTILWKPLRKMDQSLIIALAVADCMKTVAFGALASRRIYAVAFGGNDVGSQLMCMVWLSFIVFPLNTVFFLVIMLSLDRLCGLAFPIWYKNRSTRFRVAQIAVSSLLGCSIGAVMFAGVNRDKLVPVCAYGTSPTDSYLHFVKYFENFVVICALAINAVSCAILLHKWRKARRNKQALTAFKKNVQMSALKMLSAVVLVYLISSAAGSVCLMILNSSGFTDVTRMSYTPLAGLFELFRGVLDFPLYVLLVREYRNGFREVVLKRIFCCCSVCMGGGSSTVGVSTSGHHTDPGGTAGSRRVTKVAACET